MRARFTILTLIALLCVSTSIQTAVAGPEDGSPANMVYETIKEAAEARRDELLYLLDEDLLPTIMDSLQEALNSMQLAEDAYPSDIDASLQHYMDALRLFRTTWSLYLEINEEAADNTFYPVNEEDVPEVPNDLDQDIQDSKEKLLVKFQEKIIKEYTKIVDDVEELTEYISDADNEEIQTAVNSAAEKLNEIKKNIRNGEIDTVIEVFDEDSIPFHEDFDKLDDEETAETLKKIAEMGHEEHKAELKKETKEKKGHDTEDENDIIESINEEINEIKNKFKEKNENSKSNNKQSVSLSEILLNEDIEDTDVEEEEPEVEEESEVETESKEVEIEEEEPEVEKELTDKEEDKLEKEEDKIEDKLEKEEDKIEKEDSKDKDTK